MEKHFLPMKNILVQKRFCPKWINVFTLNILTTCFHTVLVLTFEEPIKVFKTAGWVENFFLQHLIWVYTVYWGLSARILRVNTVIEHSNPFTSSGHFYNSSLDWSVTSVWSGSALFANYSLWGWGGGGGGGGFPKGVNQYTLHLWLANAKLNW